MGGWVGGGASTQYALYEGSRTLSLSLRQMYSVLSLPDQNITPQQLITGFLLLLHFDLKHKIKRKKEKAVRFPVFAAEMETT